MKELAPQKVFIVSGKKSYELSGAKKKMEDLLRGVNFQRYSDFEDNPKFEDLMKGAGLIRQFNPDLVVAVGGGSVMDTAKIISILPDDIYKSKAIIKGELSVPDELAPMVAIPTTSGSGSEATHFAVAYINNRKYSVADSDLLPNYVILDSELTYSLSPYQTAVSGMDALCQGIESYWAKKATDESRSYAAEAIGIILETLEATVKSPIKQLRHKMAVGSNLAGKAINISKTTAPHALSYGLTQAYGIPHGHSVAMTMGEFLLYNTVQAERSNNQSLTETMSQIHQLFGCENADMSRKKFLQLMESIGLETKFKNITEYKVNIDKLVRNVNIQRLANHPVLVEKKDLRRILAAVS